MQTIDKIARKLDLTAQDLVMFGDDKAKIKLESIPKSRNGKLILVTAMSPSPAGEGKTTTSIGLTDAMNLIGKKSVVALREPSMGPVFGMKGGGAGGGKAQLAPAEEINLHFTGDFHAVSSAHNLLAAAKSNHIHFGNKLGFDVRRSMWERVMDVNDRSLRSIVVGLGGRLGGVPEESRFDITAASEITAILALATGLEDLRRRLSRIVLGESLDGELIRADQLKAVGSLIVLLKQALLPNLVQTLEGSPALVHSGPFANIAHGANSLIATKSALKLADYVITEAGFGADLGAEKFFDITCRKGGMTPSAAVIVATVRALKMHGGVDLKDLGTENVAAVEKGGVNLARHLENLRQYGVPVIVAVNGFVSDTPAETAAVERISAAAGAPVVTDSEMTRHAISRRFVPPGQVHCHLGDDDTAALATAAGTTRSAIAIEKAALDGAVVVIGNAPTALFALIERIVRGARPAAILAFPVGFIGAAESKEALIALHPAAPYATLRGRRGGSAMAGAALNAIAAAVPALPR